MECSNQVSQAHGPTLFEDERLHFIVFEISDKGLYIIVCYGCYHFIRELPAYKLCKTRLY